MEKVQAIESAAKAILGSNLEIAKEIINTEENKERYRIYKRK